MSTLRNCVQVNVNFRFLNGERLDFFVLNRRNPEIYLGPNTLDRCGAPEFEPLAATLRRNDLRVTFHGPFADLSAGSWDSLVREATRERLEQTLAAAAFFRPRAVVCHAGYDPRRHAYARQHWIEHSAALWSWFAQELDKLGARLALENVFENEPEDLLPLFELLGKDRVGLCLDVGHAHAHSRAPLATWVQGFGARISHLHLHDNHGARDEHLRLGQGTIDFEAFFAALAPYGPPLVATLEVDAVKDYDASLQRLERLWPWS
jgi:sugar phosphate isomerase/epimerase